MVNFEGSFVNRGKLRGQQKTPLVKAAFLYKKLKPEDEIFDWVTPLTSWRRSNPESPSVASGNGLNRFVYEIPDDVGDFATEENAKNNIPKDNRETPNDPTSVVTVVYQLGSFGSHISFQNLLKCSGAGTQNITGVPTDNPYLMPEGYYGFFKDDNDFFSGFGYQLKGIGRGDLNFVDYDVLCWKVPRPTGLSGKISYAGYIKGWKAEALLSFQGNVQYSLASSGDVETYFESDQPDDIIFFGSNGMPSTFVDAATRECSSQLTSTEFNSGDANFWQGPSIVGAELNQYGIEFDTPGSLIVSWTGNKNQIPLLEAYLESLKIYWGIVGATTFVRGASRGGCNISGPTDYPPDPEADFKTTKAIFKGRYSEIWLSIQDGKGNEIPVKLPLEFPTRVTHIKYEDNDFYTSVRPTLEEGWQPFEYPDIAELFTGRAGCDRDFIYVDILYAPSREWGEGTGLIPLSKEDFIFFRGSLALRHRIGMCDYILTSLGAYPINEDRFQKIKSYKLDWQGTILEEANYNYPDSPLITGQSHYSEAIGKYGICQVKNYPRFNKIQFEDLGAAIIPASENTWEFTGNSAVGFQVEYQGALQIYTPEDFPPFLKPQEYWTQLDKIFYELLERPYCLFLFNDNPSVESDPTKQGIFFNKNGVYGGHGRSILRPSKWYINTYENVPIYSYLDWAVEDERLRGTGIKNTEGSIVKWVRISPLFLQRFLPISTNT